MLGNRYTSALPSTLEVTVRDAVTLPIVPRGFPIVTDQPLTYPTDRVVGIAADRATVDTVRERLTSVEVSDDRVEVWCSQDTADQIDPDEPDGPVEGAIRAVQKALGEETQRLERLSDAIEAGNYVVTVSLPDGDDDDTKYAVGRALHDAGATDVAFYGTWAIEELQFGA